MLSGQGICIHFSLGFNLYLRKKLIVYSFKYLWVAYYEGRTIQRLEGRISQHVPSPIRKHIRIHLWGNLDIHHSARGDYLMNIYTCFEHYSDGCFPILHKTRTKHYLKIFKVVFTMQNGDRKNSQVGSIKKILIFLLHIISPYFLNHQFLCYQRLFSFEKSLSKSARGFTLVDFKSIIYLKILSLFLFYSERHRNAMIR